MWKWKQWEWHRRAEEHETAENSSQLFFHSRLTCVCVVRVAAHGIFSIVSSVFSALMILWSHVYASALWVVHLDGSILTFPSCTVLKYAQLIYLFAVNAFLHFRHVGPSNRWISIKMRFWFGSIRIRVDFSWWFIGATWNRWHNIHNKFQTETKNDQIKDREARSPYLHAEQQPNKKIKHNEWQSKMLQSKGNINAIGS